MTTSSIEKVKKSRVTEENSSSLNRSVTVINVDIRAERFYRYILFPDKVSIFQPRVSILFLSNFIEKSDVTIIENTHRTLT